VMIINTKLERHIDLPRPQKHSITISANSSPSRF